MCSRSADCRKFLPNIFNKSKCSHCFRQREEHSAAALECNRASRKISKCGYLFVAPDWDFSNPLYRTKRWQRRWFVLYDDGELTYSVDEHPETVPQACIDMMKVLEVSTAEDVTSHPNSLAITAPDRVTFIKGTCPEEARWWLNVLVAFPKTKGRHKRNATFPGGQATTIIQPQSLPAGRNRHNSYHQDSILSPITTNPESLSAIPVSWNLTTSNDETDLLSENNENSRVYTDQPVSSKSPPTRDKINHEEKAQVRIRNRNRPDHHHHLLIEECRRDEKLKDIANTITNMGKNYTKTNVVELLAKEPPTRDEHLDHHFNHNYLIQSFGNNNQIQRPKSLPVTSTTCNSAPAIVSALVKKILPTAAVTTVSTTPLTATATPNINTTTTALSSSSLSPSPSAIISNSPTIINQKQNNIDNDGNYQNTNNSNNNNNSSHQSPKQSSHNHERGDPDGGCNLDDFSTNYLTKNSELRVNLPAEDLLHSKKGWLMKLNSKTEKWTKHWFTLRGAALFYYRDPVAEDKGVLDGVLDINSLTSIVELTIPKNFGFQLMTWDNRRITLSAVTASIRNNWINVLRLASGLHPAKHTKSNEIFVETLVDNDNNQIINNSDLILNNTSDDFKKEIEKDFLKAQRNLGNLKIDENSSSVVLFNNKNNAIIKGDNSINSNNNETDKNLMTMGQQIDSKVTTPVTSSLSSSSSSATPPTAMTSAPSQTTITQTSPRSMLFSSDEEYRTASEGGRRDSVDWGSPLSPSPPAIPFSILRTKDRTPSSRPSSNARLHNRSRSSPPSSRRSTVDSVKSNDMPPLIIPMEEELQLRLLKSEQVLSLLREEAQEREARMLELLQTLERTEFKLTARIKEAEEARDKLALQLNESELKSRETIEHLQNDLEDSKNLVRELEDRLSRGIEENEGLYKRLREVEHMSPINSLCSFNRLKMKRVDSLSDLTSLNDINPYSLERDLLADEYQELKQRFEKAVNEIKAMKRELKESQNQFDALEIQYVVLKQDFDQKNIEEQSQLSMMAARIQDLTLKNSSAERLVRALKQKLTKTDKRRSLSLKGKESLTIQKELEEKITELESKIDALQLSAGGNQKIPVLTPESPSSSSLSQSVGEQKSLRRGTSRLRRKSLESPQVESMEVLLRLNKLEKRVEKAQQSEVKMSIVASGNDDPIDNNANAQLSITSCSNSGNIINSSPKVSGHLVDRLRCLEEVIVTIRDRIEQSLQQLHNLKSSTRSRRSVSPGGPDRKDSIRHIERCLTEGIRLLKDCCDNCTLTVASSRHVNLLPDSDPIKLAICQMENQLRSKLDDLLKRRRVLRERNELSQEKNLELLAERIAFESVCFGKLRDAVNRAEEPSQFGEKQTLSEVVETVQLMSQLRNKLSGKCAIKPNSGSVDLLAGVLAKRLLLAAGKSHRNKVTDISELAPISPYIMNDLLRQQNELNLIVNRYKNTVIENLACGLAAETLSYISGNDAVQGVVQEAWRQAQESVNAELVQSEIVHIMMRNAQRYENSMTPSFGYTLTSDERISFEKYADAVQDAVRREMDSSIIALTQCYEESLNKMKQGQGWRLHLEQERTVNEGRQLFAEFADISAHKAMVDARIAVLRGDYVSKELISAKENIFSIDALQKYEDLFFELATDLQIANPEDILIEADFNFMFKFFTNKFLLKNRLDINEICDSLRKMDQLVAQLQDSLDSNGSSSSSVASPAHSTMEEIKKLSGISSEIRSRLELIFADAKNIENLAAVTKKCEDLEKQKSEIIEKFDQEKQLTSKCEQKIEELSEKLRQLEDLCFIKDKERTELSENYEKVVDKLKDLSEMEQKNKKLLKENNQITEQLTREKERVKKLEKRIEVLVLEHTQQLENLQSNHKEQQIANEGNMERDKTEEDTLRQRYQAEIEHLRALCEKGLAAMESSHRKIINELEEKHQHEIRQLLCDKEQALAEETQATLAALDAMRKAHQSEVQREVARFKQEFINKFQRDGQSSGSSHKEKEQELEEVRQEILSLSEKYSIKCVETATLEEKLKITVQQLRNTKQQIQQLETRNRQLRAHLLSEESDLGLPAGLVINSSPSTVNAHVGEVGALSSSPTSSTHTTPSSSSSDRTLSQNKKELHPRSKFSEGVKLSHLVNYTSPNSSSIITASNPSTLIPLEPMKTKIISTKNLNMKLTDNRLRSPTKNFTINDSVNGGGGSTSTSSLVSIKMAMPLTTGIGIGGAATSILQCSSPLLDEKDTEQTRRFELEI